MSEHKKNTPVLSYTVDANIPVSPDVSPKDPSHPANLIGDLIYTQNQATADTKYDAFPPKRTYESFAQEYSVNIYLIVFIAFLFLLYGVYTTPVLAGSNAQQTFHFFFFVWIVGMALMFVTRFLRV